jgi:hypothetical protein
MSETFDPDERFSLDMEPEEVFKRILDGEGADDIAGEPEDVEEADS